MEAKIIILGSSASNPFPRTQTNRFQDYFDIQNYARKFKLHDDPICESAKKGGKDRRTRACLALLVNKKVILIDAGPDIKYQLKKHNLKPDVVFITHNHLDASYGLRYLSKSVEVFSEKIGNIKHGKVIDLFGINILPFRVIHSKIAPFTGYKIFIKNKKIVYISDLASLKGVKDYLKDSDILFSDGSILKKKLTMHLPIINQLKIYKIWRLKRVIFTHIGHATLKHDDLVKFVKEKYKNTDVAFDGMTIKF